MIASWTPRPWSATAWAGRDLCQSQSSHGFQDHQLTHAEAVRRERRAEVAVPLAQVRRNARSVRQLDQQLLRQEAADPPGGLDRLTMFGASRDTDHDPASVSASIRTAQAKPLDPDMP